MINPGSGPWCFPVSPHPRFHETHGNFAESYWCRFSFGPLESPPRNDFCKKSRHSSEPSVEERAQVHWKCTTLGTASTVKTRHLATTLAARASYPSKHPIPFKRIRLAHSCSSRMCSIRFMYLRTVHLLLGLLRSMRAVLMLSHFRMHHIE